MYRAQLWVTRNWNVLLELSLCGFRPEDGQWVAYAPQSVIDYITGQQKPSKPGRAVPKELCFPLEVSEGRLGREGRKLLAKAVERRQEYLEALPFACLSAFENLGTSILKRRLTSSTQIVLILAEQILQTVAIETKPEVMVSFETLRVAYEHLTGKEIKNNSIRAALEHLDKNSQGTFEVTNWGKKNERHTSTRVRVHLDPYFDESVSSVPRGTEVEQWMDSYAHIHHKISVRNLEIRDEVWEHKNKERGLPVILLVAGRALINQQADESVSSVPRGTEVELRTIDTYNQEKEIEVTENSEQELRDVIDFSACPKCRSDLGSPCRDKKETRKKSHPERAARYKQDFSGLWAEKDLSRALREMERNQRLVNSGTTFRSQY